MHANQTLMQKHSDNGNVKMMIIHERTISK